MTTGIPSSGPHCHAQVVGRRWRVGAARPNAGRCFVFVLVTWRHVCLQAVHLYRFFVEAPTAAVSSVGFEAGEEGAGFSFLCTATALKYSCLPHSYLVQAASYSRRPHLTASGASYSWGRLPHGSCSRGNSSSRGRVSRRDPVRKPRRRQHGEHAWAAHKSALLPGVSLDTAPIPTLPPVGVSTLE